MWPFRTVAPERELYEVRRELAEYKARDAQTKFNAMQSNALHGAMGRTIGATTAPAPKTATDLPMTRVADLAGYLGRVHEQLSMAAIAVAPYEEDPEKTKKIELAQHFKAAAAKAAQVQLDLLKIIQEAREDEAARAIRAQAEAEHADIAQTLRDAMQNRPQWAPEDLERYRNAATATEPLEPNRIKPLDDPYDDNDPART